MLSRSKITDLICYSKCMLSRSQIVCWIHELNIGCYLEVEQCNVFSTSIFHMDASPIIFLLSRSSIFHDLGLQMSAIQKSNWLLRRSSLFQPELMLLVCSVSAFINTSITVYLYFFFTIN